MRILAVADTPSPPFQRDFDPARWAALGVELIVSCGDLSAEYLGFLADAFRVPLFYVRGNHDADRGGARVGDNLDGRVLTFRGVRFLGLEGSPWYNGGEVQYGELAMTVKLLQLRPVLWVSRGVDVVVTHAAPRFCPQAYRLCQRPIGVGRVCPHLRGAADTPHVCQDAADHPHRGFEGFRRFVLAAQPRFLLHGHRHQTFGLGKREVRLGQTRVVDACGHIVLDI